LLLIPKFILPAFVTPIGPDSYRDCDAQPALSEAKCSGFKALIYQSSDLVFKACKCTGNSHQFLTKILFFGAIFSTSVDDFPDCKIFFL